MARLVLVLDEVLAMLRVVDVPQALIERFRQQAEAVLARKLERRIDVSMRPWAQDASPEAEARPAEVPEGTDWITVSSSFGQSSQQGVVNLTVNETRTQMPVKKAREIGLMLIEAAEAAASDEIFIRLLGRLGIDGTEKQGRLLLELREIRQGTRGTSWPT